MDSTRARRQSIVWRARLANLFGAVMAFVYFRFIDPIASGPDVTWPEIVFSVVAFTVLTVTGARLATRWAAPMLAGDRSSTEARRRALLFPWVTAGVSLINWMIAGVLFGVVGPLLAGWSLTVQSAVRAIIGITVVGDLGRRLCVAAHPYHGVAVPQIHEAHTHRGPRRRSHLVGSGPDHPAA